MLIIACPLLYLWLQQISERLGPSFDIVSLEMYLWVSMFRYIGWSNDYRHHEYLRNIKVKEKCVQRQLHRYQLLSFFHLVNNLFFFIFQRYIQGDNCRHTLCFRCEALIQCTRRHISYMSNVHVDARWDDNLFSTPRIDARGDKMWYIASLPATSIT